MKEQEHANSGSANEMITAVIKEIDADAREVRLLLGVLDYDAPYLLHYDLSLYLPQYGNAKNKIYDFLIRVDMLKTVTILEQKKK